MSAWIQVNSQLQVIGGFKEKFLAKSPGLYYVPKVRNATTTTATITTTTTTTISYLVEKLAKQNKLLKTDFMSHLFDQQTNLQTFRGKSFHIVNGY